MPQAPEELPEFGQDVVINDAPANVRYLLTKRTTQVRCPAPIFLLLLRCATSSLPQAT